MRSIDKIEALVKKLDLTLDELNRELCLKKWQQNIDISPKTRLPCIEAHFSPGYTYNQKHLKRRLQQDLQHLPQNYP